MYHMIVKRQVRRGFRLLSAGDYEAVLRHQASLRDGRLYRNAGMQYARLRWGRIVEDHIYEDTQTLALELQQMAHQGIGEAVVLPTSAR